MNLFDGDDIFSTEARLKSFADDFSKGNYIDDKQKISAVVILTLVIEYICNTLNQERHSHLELLKCFEALAGPEMHIFMYMKQHCSAVFREFTRPQFQNDKISVTNETLLKALQLWHEYYQKTEKVDETLETSYLIVADLLNKNNKTEKKNATAITPQAIKKYCDKYVIGQTVAKEMLGLEISEFVNGINRNTRKAIPLIIGPSGNGKNYLLSTIANYPPLNAEIVVIDVSRVTPSGYAGNSIISEIEESVPQHHKDFVIVVFNEIDGLCSENVVGEESDTEKFHNVVIKQLLTILSGETQIKEFEPAKTLFLACGAFEEIRRKKRTYDDKKIGFGAASISSVGEKSSSITKADLYKYLGREFASRISYIITLKELTNQELKMILEKSVDQFKSLFYSYGIELTIQNEAIEMLTEKISDMKLGAREVDNTLQEVLNPIRYRAIEKENLSEVVITANTIRTGLPIYHYNRAEKTQ